MKNLYLILLIFCSTSVCGTSNKFEDLFLEGKYSDAAKQARIKAKTEPEYLLLAGVAHQLADEYTNSNAALNYFKNMQLPLSNVKKLVETQFPKNNHYRRDLFFGVSSLVGFPLDDKDSFYHFNEAFTKNKNDPNILNYLSFLEAGRGDYIASIRHADNGIRSRPSFGDLYGNKAFSLLKIGKKEEAIETLLECFKKCTVISDNVMYSFIDLTCMPVINTIAPNGQMSLVKVPSISDPKIYDKISELSITSPNNYLRIVSHFISMKEHRQFKNKLDVIKVSESLQEYLLYLKSMIAYYSGDSEYFQKNIIKLNNFKDLKYKQVYEIGFILSELKLYDEALVFYKKSLDMSDGLDYDQRLPNLSNIGNMYLIKKEYPMAEKYFSEALSLYSEDFISNLNIGVTYYWLNNKKSSLEHLKKAKTLIPDKGYLEYIEQWIAKAESL
ncbi:tetratricopeptide repeat protein (plasmid) [Leptospira noguchii]|uniref:tetratricopeptide repeat protein n=1 Tax=Leptospira noguchii TaxID=28182 RepID=UPI001FB64651|nr:tetratricopeptide repeat protein [Leptospira noguchii]UOG39972.1 tetratricopeptide repeat protein [Leptospira noguchii]